jgi:DNA-binding GntR family transcriptional regulator
MASNKTNQVYEELYRRIVSLELVPGSPINEGDIAAAIGVSKTPVREALRQLEKDGLIEHVTSRGSTVSHITPSEIEDVFEIREIIESGAARRVAELGPSLELLSKLERDKILLRSRDAADELVDEWGVTEDIHISILRALRNDLLLDVYSRLIGRIARIRRYYRWNYTSRRLHDILLEHTAILDAITRRDGNLAEAAMQLHLKRAGAFMSKANAAEEGARA